jgi:hypothetical protein
LDRLIGHPPREVPRGRTALPCPRGAEAFPNLTR